MTIDAELEAHILRLYHVEKWRCGTIARQLYVHRCTVKRVLAQAGLPRHGPAPRPSMKEELWPWRGSAVTYRETTPSSRVARR